MTHHPPATLELHDPLDRVFPPGAFAPPPTVDDLEVIADVMPCGAHWATRIPTVAVLVACAVVGALIGRRFARRMPPA